jgi:hypothetical protein
MQLTYVIKAIKELLAKPELYIIADTKISCNFMPKVLEELSGEIILM